MVKSSQRGVTLIEVLIVLGIASIVTGGVWVAANTALAKYKENRIVEQAELLMTGVRKVFMNSQIDVAGADVADTLTHAGVIPSDMLSGNISYPVDIYGAPIIFDVYYSNYKISFGGLPQKACVALINHFLKGVHSEADLRRAGLSNVIVFGTITGRSAGIVAKDYRGWGGFNSRPYTLPAIIDACEPVGQSHDKDGNVIPGTGNNADYVSLWFDVTRQ